MLFADAVRAWVARPGSKLKTAVAPEEQPCPNTFKLKPWPVAALRRDAHCESHVMPCPELDESFWRALVDDAVNGNAGSTDVPPADISFSGHASNSTSEFGLDLIAGALGQTPESMVSSPLAPTVVKQGLSGEGSLALKLEEAKAELALPPIEASPRGPGREAIQFITPNNTVLFALEFDTCASDQASESMVSSPLSTLTALPNIFHQHVQCGATTYPAAPTRTSAGEKKSMDRGTGDQRVVLPVTSLGKPVYTGAQLSLGAFRGAEQLTPSLSPRAASTSDSTQDALGAEDFFAIERDLHLLPAVMLPRCQRETSICNPASLVPEVNPRQEHQAAESDVVGDALRERTFLVGHHALKDSRDTTAATQPNAVRNRRAVKKGFVSKKLHHLISDSAETIAGGTKRNCNQEQTRALVQARSAGTAIQRPPVCEGVNLSTSPRIRQVQSMVPIGVQQQQPVWQTGVSVCSVHSINPVLSHYSPVTLAVHAVTLGGHMNQCAMAQPRRQGQQHAAFGAGNSKGRQAVSAKTKAKAKLTSSLKRKQGKRSMQASTCSTDSQAPGRATQESAKGVSMPRATVAATCPMTKKSGKWVLNPRCDCRGGKRKLKVAQGEGTQLTLRCPHTLCPSHTGAPLPGTTSFSSLCIHFQRCSKCKLFRSANSMAGGCCRNNKGCQRPNHAGGSHMCFSLAAHAAYGRNSVLQPGPQ